VTAGAAGPGGSGRLAIQRMRRKARSLSAWLPKRAVQMIVSATASSIAIVIWPSRGSATPMPIGAPSEVRPMPAVRQGTRPPVRGRSAGVSCPAFGAMGGLGADGVTVTLCLSGPAAGCVPRQVA
jgi:hypothetical protein